MIAANSSLLAIAFDAQMVRYVVWSGLVGLTVTLLVLMRTRWGQSNPLGKCMVLSLLAHLLLGIYTTTVHIVSGGAGPGEGPPMRVALMAPGEDSQEDAAVEGQPWNHLGETHAAALGEHLSTDVGPAPGAIADPDIAPTARQVAPQESALPDGLSTSAVARTANETARPPLPAAPIEAPLALRADPPKTIVPSDASAPVTDSSDIAPQRKPADSTANPFDPLAASPPAADPEGQTSAPPVRPNPAALATANPLDSAGNASPANTGGVGRLVPAAIPGGVGAGAPIGDPAGEPGGGAGTSEQESIGIEVGPVGVQRATETMVPVPAIYQLRTGDHTREALAQGGTRETEAAVVAALHWLVAHQSQDGRWDGQRLEAGREAAIDGHERRGAGSRADTGISGLALLSLQASGHTHLQGEHRDAVRQGLQYLLSIQAADGNLGGNATLYEKMYCHAMASFALSEAYAMTHDDRLQQPVRRAIGYTLAAQHGGTGGWRYQPGESGDMSQLGWQFMALKSAELAGIPIPRDCREGMIRFIKSVSSGDRGGLASYRPGFAPSRTMTAEALVCRQFLGMAQNTPVGDEAGNFILGELPGQREPNFYYWYYGTLATYQLQDAHWRRWNLALSKTLVSSQRTDGDQAGSWDPDPLWGAYGGRAYSTALGALCLEVYYRFLPFHAEAAGRDRVQK